jgi:hypothetical protein
VAWASSGHFQSNEAGLYADQSVESLERFHQTLLPATLENALRTPFYAALWAQCDASTITKGSLSRLPLVDKQAIRLAGRAAQNRAGLRCDEIYTSGTTGTPLVTVNGDREQHYIHSFYSASLAERDRPQRRGLLFNNLYHGHHTSIPVPIHFHKVGIYDGSSFEHGRRVIAGRHEDANVDDTCTLVYGLERNLRAFTTDTRDRYQIFPSNLEMIISCTSYLTAGWRALHERTWGCPVVDRFGLSEVFGGATQDLTCGWWHFDPVVIPEVIGHRSGAVLREGRGLLVMTGLFPFQEAQPMVRYSTGDLVDVTHACSSRPGHLAIRPLGRAHCGVPFPEGDEWLLTPAQIHEVIESLPGIDRVPLYRDSPQVRDPYAIGHPKYRIDYDVKLGEVRIDLRIVLRSGADQSRARAHVIVGFLERETPLGDAVAAGEASLNIAFEPDLAPQFISRPP